MIPPTFSCSLLRGYWTGLESAAWVVFDCSNCSRTFLPGSLILSINVENIACRKALRVFLVPKCTLLLLTQGRKSLPATVLGKWVLLPHAEILVSVRKGMQPPDLESWKPLAATVGLVRLTLELILRLSLKSRCPPWFLLTPEVC